MAETPEVLDCGHPPSESPGPGTGVATNTVTGKTMCYGCATDQHRQQLLKLDEGDSYVVYTKFAPPHGRTPFPPGEEGAVTSWTGEELGNIVPTTLKVQKHHGFHGIPATGYHFRALVSGEVDGEPRTVLLYGRSAGDGMVARVKRLIDRVNPAGEPPQKGSRAYVERKAKRAKEKQLPHRARYFDYEDTEEL